MKEVGGTKRCIWQVSLPTSFQSRHVVFRHQHLRQSASVSNHGITHTHTHTHTHRHTHKAFIAEVLLHSLNFANIALAIGFGFTFRMSLLHLESI